MRPVFVFALTAGAVVALSARAATTVVRSSADLVAPAGIDVISDSVLPTIQTQNLGSALGSGASSTTRSAAAGNAALTIRTQNGVTLSMAVPESFAVVRSGGTEELTVKTTTDTNLHIVDRGVVLGGNGLGEGTMSVKVGGLVNLASAGTVAPGPYEGTLVVLVQYN